MSKIDSNSENNSPLIAEVFEENETLLQFYDKFRGLNHLETLTVDFSVDSDAESHEYQSYLLHALLKRIPTLTKLTSRLSLGCRYLNESCSDNLNDHHLARLFESCHSFSETLQTLEIGHEKIIYSGFDFSASQNRFPRLSSAKITGQFEEEALPLLQGLVSLGESLTKIKLLVKMNNTANPLISLLQQISKFKMPSRLSVELEVKVWGSINLEDLKSGFDKVICELESNEQASLNAKRTSLKIYTDRKSKEIKDVLVPFGKRFEEFQVI